MKKQMLFVRFVTLTLICAMLTVSFVGCLYEEDEKQETGRTEQSGETTPGEFQETCGGWYEDPLPFDPKFDRVVSVLGEESQKTQYLGEGKESPDVVLRVVFKRNERVQERLGITFAWTHKPGGPDSIDLFVQEVETVIKGGTGLDATVCYSLVPQVLAQKGMAANLYGRKYLDLSAPWWPSAYMEEMTVNNTLYSLVEANDYGLLKGLTAMFFHSEMLEARGLESPYTLVKDNEWDIAKLSELIKDTYEDTNSNAGADVDGDTFGYCAATDNRMDAWLFGLGYRLSKLSKNNEKDILVSNVNAGYFQPYIDTMVTFFHSKSVCASDTEPHKMFLEERVCFYSADLRLINSIKSKELKIKYGMVPMPKLDKTQERYYTHPADTYDAWCIPVSAPDFDCVSAVLECMASESYRNVGPIFLEQYVQNRLAPNVMLVEMGYLLQDSVTFDYFRLYSYGLNKNPEDLIASCITDPTENRWASIYSANELILNDAFDKIAVLYSK